MTWKKSSFIAIFFMLLAPTVRAQATLKEMLRIWNDESQADTIRLWAIDSIVWKVYPNQPDSALPYAKEQSAWARSRGNSRWIAIAEQNIGTAYYLMGDIVHALDHYKEALVWMEKSGNKRGMAGSLINIGIQYGNQGDLKQSLEYTLAGLKIAEEIDDKEFQGNALGRLGTLNFEIGNVPEARDYFERALRVNEASGDKNMLASSLVNLGILLAREGEFPEALTYTLRSAALFKALDGKYGLADAYDNLGYIYGATGDPKQEMEYYLLALDTKREIGNNYGVAYTLNLIGNVYMKQQAYAQAIDYFQQSFAMFQEIGDINVIKNVAHDLYLAYKATGQLAPALEMHERWIQLKDSIFTEENTKSMMQQQFQYEQDKKDALAQAEIKRQSLMRNAALGGLGLVGLLAFVLYRNSRRRRKTNELLTSQKAEIEVKSNQNELLLKEIHHRVKNNLQTISSLLFLQSAHIQDEDIKQAVAAGQHRVESMALIHQKLYQRDNLAAIEMKDYLSNLVRSLIGTFDADPNRIKFNLDMPELELDVDTAVPLGLIVNELITNALKYAFPDGRTGEITVSLKQDGEQMELLVADNGVGKANTATGTSFGSQLVRLLTAQLGGQLAQEVTDGYLTRVRFPPHNQ